VLGSENNSETTYAQRQHPANVSICRQGARLPVRRANRYRWSSAWLCSTRHSTSRRCSSGFPCAIMTGRKGWGGENYREKWSLNDLNCLACFGSISNGALTLETQQQLIAMINGFPEREILADGIYKAVLRYSELLRLSTPMSHRITHHITGRRPYPLALLSCRIFALYSFFRLRTGSFCCTLQVSLLF